MVFDCLDYKVLIGKLNFYVLTLPALKLIHGYLLHKKQRTKMSTSYSDWLKIVFGIHQASILGASSIQHLFRRFIFYHEKDRNLQAMQMITRHILVLKTLIN